MSGRRTAARVLLGLAITTLVVSIVGFAVSMVLNAFVFDEFDAYGEVSIPGEQTLHLPAGEVSVSFHAVVIGSGDGGLPVPPLGLSIIAPDGVADDDVLVVENFGSTTTVNNDARVRVWVVTIPAEGDYLVQADGEVNGYVNPRLAFGHGSAHWWLVWLFVGLFVLSIVDLVVALVWMARIGRTPVFLQPSQFDGGSYPHSAPPLADPSTSYTPTEDRITAEQLRTIAALRDSGALTEDEFQAEKRRLLDGY